MRAVVACLFLLILAAYGGMVGDGLPGNVDLWGRIVSRRRHRHLRSRQPRHSARVGRGPDERYDVKRSDPDCLDINWMHYVAFTAMSSTWICGGEQAVHDSIAFRSPSTDRPAQCGLNPCAGRKPSPVALNGRAYDASNLEDLNGDR
jgi:hypothetical protein